jgi:hypothetical protein
MSTLARFGAVVLSAAMVSGCYAVRPQATPLTFVPSEMTTVGHVEGVSRRNKLLCLFQPDQDTGAQIGEAEAAALADVHGDAILNPAVNDETFYGVLFLWCTRTIRISGQAVRFKTRPEAPAAAKKS